MKINILTIFPEMFNPLKKSMLGRAEENGIIEFNIVDVRDFSLDKHKKTDDYPFGGGPGMIFMPQPAFDALKSVGAESTRNIYMSPRGRILDKDFAIELSEYLQGNDLTDYKCKSAHDGTAIGVTQGLTIFCGHYEGIDQRIIDYWNMEEVSIGDYILTGGELAAMVLIDTVTRLIPGVLGEENSAMDESIYSGLLEYPQYTQPREYIMNVPEVLLSGNHKGINLWRFRESIRLTRKRRPDLLKAFLKDSHQVKAVARTEFGDEVNSEAEFNLETEFSKEELKVLFEELSKSEIAFLRKNLSDVENKKLDKLISAGAKTYGKPKNKG